MQVYRQNMAGQQASTCPAQNLPNFPAMAGGLEFIAEETDEGSRLRARRIAYSAKAVTGTKRACISEPKISFCACSAKYGSAWVLEDVEHVGEAWDSAWQMSIPRFFLTPKPRWSKPIQSEPCCSNSNAIGTRRWANPFPGRSFEQVAGLPAAQSTVGAADVGHVELSHTPNGIWHLCAHSDSFQSRQVSEDWCDWSKIVSKLMSCEADVQYTALLP